MKRPLFLIAMVMLLAVVPVLAQDAAPEPVGLRYDAPPYAVHGPYWVGTRDYVIEPDSARPTRVTVWYPALNPDGREEAVIYNLARVNTLEDLTEPGTQLQSIGHALADAAPDSAGAPYPLMVFSHGATAWAQGYNYFNEHVASWGFVVIAPDHLDEVPSAGVAQHWTNTITRPQDVSRVLDYAEATLNTGDLTGMIDMEHVAVSGQSFGGMMAVLEGGALLNTESWQAWCDSLPDAESVEDCQTLAYLDQMAGLIGLDKAPEGVWPPLNDPRVDAIIGLSSGGTYQFGEEGLAAVAVPALMIFGDQDTMVGELEWGGYGVYQHITSPKVMVRFQNAWHGITIDKCSTMPWAEEMGLSVLCSDFVWDMDRAHDLINHFGAAFLLDTLKGDQDAHAALLPENVAFLGIMYETTMK